MRAHSSGTRILMVVVGCPMLVTHLGLAAVGYLGLAFLWRSAPGPASAAANGRRSEDGAPGLPHKRFWRHAP